MLRFVFWIGSKTVSRTGTVKIWREIQLARIREMAAQNPTPSVRTEASTPKESREPELYVDAGKWRSEKPSPGSITAMQNQFFAIMEKPMVFDTGQRVPASKPRLPEPKFDRTEISRLAEYLRANHAALLDKKLPPGPQASSEDLLTHACYQFLHVAITRMPRRWVSVPALSTKRKNYGLATSSPERTNTAIADDGDNSGSYTAAACENPQAKNRANRQYGAFQISRTETDSILGIWELARHLAPRW